ncbi:hypothetical protein [Vibrio diazotrophicus]|uniref:hypothetical protein n=1 Tax=Vibrio diazotrophicus TaxID=685 RepID=UPI000C9E7CAF|nr:hypothetical protein [Vibrio diazotrophicus]PNH81341.1 hypothetical protein C1N27_07295 [Vibrio diazotrophicus]
MNPYSNKITQKTFDNEIIKAVKLSPITSSIETIKLIKAIAPSLGSALDGVMSQDRTLMFSSMLNILSMNLNSDELDRLQILLLGSLLNSEDQPLTTAQNINSYLEAHPNLNTYDLLCWRFETELLKPLLDSDLVKSNLDKLNGIKGMFDGLFAELPDVQVAEDEAITE